MAEHAGAASDRRTLRRPSNQIGPRQHRSRLIELSRLVGRILRDHPELTGLWHVAGEPIDKHALLLKLRDVLHIDCKIVPRDEPVINRALDGSRFEGATGYRPPTWNEMLEEYVIPTDG